MTMRISGLSSGLDYESWIKDLMKAERTPLNEMGQKKTILQWKKEDYTTLYNSISDFRNMVFNYKLQNTLQPKKVSTTDDDVVTVTANADAGNMSHTLDVYQLADGVKLTSTAGLASNTDKTSLATQFGLTTDVDIKINGQEIKVTKDKSIYELVSAINNAGADVKASYDATLDRFFLSSTKTGSSAGISFYGSDTTSDGGLKFITDKLKLKNTAVDTTGVASIVKLLPATPSNVQLSALGVSGSLNLKINNGASSATVALNSSMTLQQALDSINSAAGVNASVTYDTNTGKVTLKAKNEGETLNFSGSDAGAMSFLNNSLKLSTVTEATTVNSTGVTSSDKVLKDTDVQLNFLGVSGSFNLKINNGDLSTTVALNSSMTLQQALDSINSSVDDTNHNSMNVSATYADGKVTLKATSGTLDFSGSDAGALSFLNNGLELNLPSQGKDATISLDGTYLLESTNNFTISGMTYTLKSTSPVTSTGDVVSTNIVTNDDVDAEVKIAQSFIDSYNKILATVNGKLDEKYDRDYMPLTDDQKSSMKDNEITAWQAKARTGLFHSDSILQSMVDVARESVSDPVTGLNGKYNTASFLGITTGDWEEGGKLHLNETQLRTALQEDPEALSKLFTTSGTDSAHSGIAQRLYDSLKTAMDQIDEEAGPTQGTNDTQSTLAKEITDYTDDMKDMKTRIDDKENQYYTQFSAMETALQQLNSQSSWLSNMLGTSG